MVTRLVQHFGFGVTMLKDIPTEDMVNQELLSHTPSAPEDPEHTRTWSQSALSAYTHIPSQVFLVALQL